MRAWRFTFVFRAASIDAMERSRRLGKGVAMQIEATDARGGFWNLAVLTAVRAFMETVKRLAPSANAGVGASPTGAPGNVAPRQGVPTPKRRRKPHARKRAGSPDLTVEQ
jgi:hypothetical protein